MESDLRLRAKDIDASLLGNRLREARVRAGLTQGEVAGEDASTAYISRIESGTRRPSAALLQRLSVRLDVPVQELLAPAAPPPRLVEQEQRIHLALDYAELALKTGDVPGSLAQVEKVLADDDIPTHLHRHARYLKALALEALGETNDAINLLEDLTEGPADTRLVETFTALSRCYRYSGDLHRAADVGDRAEERIDEELWSLAEGVRLTMTVSAAHYERGDVNHAIRICSRVLERADKIDSPQTLAYAYWNLSVYQQRQGHIAEALRMAEQALELFDPTDDARNIARLRTQLGRMELRADPPQTASAIRNLLRSQEEMTFTYVAPADRLSNVNGLARAHFLDGRYDEARAILGSLLDESDVSPLVLAEALALEGQIDLAEDRHERAVASFRRSIALLDGVGADRYVGELWVELADIFESLGLTAEAMVAYRGAAATSGLVARSTLPATLD